MAAATLSLHKLNRGRVYQGPFKGLWLARADVFGPQAPLILGTYEQELHCILEELRRTNPRYILNIGGGGGYYAVGSAAIWGARKIIVYESLERGRQTIELNALHNSVGGACEIRGTCTEEDLFGLMQSGVPDILIMDVEGAELDLLSHRVRMKLIESHVIIESHDFARPGCTETLHQWFADTHRTCLIETRSRCCADFTSKIPLPCALKLKLMDERRPERMTWLVGHPKRQLTED